MNRKERGISGVGVMIVVIGAVVALGLWLVAIFVLPVSSTNEDLTKLPKVAIDPLSSGSSGSTSSSSTGSGSSSSASSSSGSSSSGAAASSSSGAAASSSSSSSGGQSAAAPGPNGMPYQPQTPKDTKLMATSMPGYQIFSSTCSGCHGSNAEGSFGPELLGIGNVANEQKLIDFITAGKNGMPPSGGLSSAAQVKQAADWLMKQTQK